MDNLIKRLNAIEDLAVEVQCHAYHMSPGEQGCPRGHMGKSGSPGNDTRSKEERVDHLLIAIKALLKETLRDQAATMRRGS